MSFMQRTPASTTICVAAILGMLPAGCAPSNVPQTRKIEVAHDPLKQARSYLEGYAQGLPVGSERELFPKLVEEIRQIDANKAATLESVFAEIVKSPATARDQAKKLLDRL